MKKFLSALTAFCMGASMIASTLPASALTPLLKETPKAQADGFVWDISDAKAEDGVAYIDVTVQDDPGSNAYGFQIQIEKDGKWVSFAEAGLEVADIAKGTAYDRMSMFAANLDEGSAAASNDTDIEPQYAVNGAPVVTYGVLIPDNYAEGVYNLRFNNLKVAAADGKTMLKPTATQGTLTIGDVQPTASSNTTKPTSNTTKPTTGTGNNDTPNVGADDFVWDISDAKAEEGVAYIDVTVQNDPGSNAYGFQIQIQKDGKWMSFAEAGLEVADIAKGTAYDRMSMFAANLDEGSAAASNDTDIEPQYAVDGKPVVTYGVLVPDGYAEGVYNLRFNNLKVAAADGKTMLSPTATQGTLTIGEAVVPPTNTDPTEPTDAPVVEGFVWDISDAKAEDGVAYIDVTVQDDPGSNAYGFQIQIKKDGKWMSFAEAGLEVADIAKGTAYDRMSMFAANLDEGSAAASNDTDIEPQYAVDGKPVVTYGVLVPDDFPEGVYDLRFNNLKVAAADGKTMLKPTATQGTLTVGDTVVPTEPTEPPVVEGFVWDIGDGVAEDGVAYVDVTVQNDPGSNAYGFQILIKKDGKWMSFAEAGLEVADISKGTAYDRMSMFAANLDEGSAAASNDTDIEPQYAVDGKPVVTYGVLVPDDFPEGVYDLKFNNLKVAAADGKTMLNPTATQGTLTVGGAVTPTEPVEGFVWDIADAVAEGGIAYIDVTVEKDPGTNAYGFQMLIEKDGKWMTLKEFGLEVAEITNGKAYDRMSMFAPYLDEGSIAAANDVDVEPQYAKEGVPVVTFGVLVPDTIPAGTYNLKFQDLNVAAPDGKTMLNPEQTQGTLTIGDAPVPTEPFEPTTEEIDAEWIIGTVEAEPGEVVSVPVTVKGDVDGINSYIADLGQDAGPVANDAAKGAAYEALDFISNMDTLEFAGTNYTLNKNVVAADNAVVFEVTFKVPDDASGTYDITFEDLLLYNIDMVQLIPKKTNGWIKVTTPDPTASSSEIDAEWIIGTVEAEPGETVTVPVTVKGDKDGLNSYIADLGQDAGPTADGAAAGDAYAALGFEANIADLKFGGTNHSTNANVVAADNAVVFNVTFKVPADAAAGTVYDITFEDLEIYNIDMVQLIPKKTNGWIKIKDTDFVEESSKIDAEWIIGTVEAEPGETVTVPVTVKGDKDGLNSYIADLGQDAGPVAGEATKGDAYAALDFASNITNLTFGGTNYTLGENVVAADNAVVFNVTFKVPDDAAPGTVYDITFEDLSIYNIDMVRLIPTQTDGWIKIKDEEPTEATTNDPGEWIIGTVEAEPGETVTVPVTVKGDKNGLNSYIADLGQDEGPTADGAAAGDAYANIGFEFNKTDLKFGGTNYTTGENVPAADNAVVFNITFKVPDDAAPGTVYDIFFENLEVIDSNMSSLTPKKTDGWIKIKDVETTESTTTTETTADTTATTTTAATTADTTDTTEETTTTTEPVTPGEAGQWIIGTTVVEAGATVTIPVTVKGDKNGINSYILDMGQDAGPVANDAAKGDAYAALDFIFNMDNLTFAGTNYTLGENVVPADDAVVFNVTFKVPDDAAPGTIYNLTFEGLTVYDINMNELNPEKVPGWIKIADEESTTEPTDTTPVATPAETTTTPATSDTPAATTTTPATSDTPANTTETTETTKASADTPDDPPVTIPPEEAGQWIIGTTVVEAGATVTIPVTVKGDKNGINSFILDMGQDAGPVANDAAEGNAYEALDFIYNLDNLTFAGTNYTLSENVMAADDAVVLNVTFKVPDDAAPGTVYNLTFEGLEVYDINMNVLQPEQIPGWIKIADEESTTVPTDTTPVVTDTTPVVTDTTPVVTDTTPVVTDTTPVVTDTTPVVTDTTPVVTDTTPVVTDTTPVVTDTTPVVTDTTPVVTDTTPVVTDTTPVVTDTTPVVTDTTPVVTDTTPVVTDTTPVVTDTTPVVTDTTPATTETTPVTTTTTTTATSATTTTTETTTTESQPVPGAATWQIGTVEAKPGQKVTVNVTVYGDTGLNSYQFKMNQDAGPTANAASAGNAYPTLGFEYALDTLTFGGTSTGAANVVAADGAVVVGVTFTVPKDAKPGTIYNLTFDGDVEAIDANMVALDITEVAGWIKVLDADVTVTGYEYEVVGKSKFYLSHDMRPFDPADLVTTVMQYTLYSDGTKSEGVELNIAEVTFDIPGWTNPEEVFNAQVLDAEGNPKADYDVYYKGSIPATITDPLGEVHNLPAVGTAYIAVKGDATLTGEADAKDAAIVLTYAAKKGAGMDAYIYSETDAELEAFAYFLTDVTGESEDNGATDSLGNAGSDCDAKDAAKILVYAAIQGSGKYADWAQILSEPLPKYTAAIDAYRKANA